MDRRGSQDSEKKVRIKLKTDTVKQDPRSVKAPKGKSALKKDGEYDSSLSPDTSLTSQLRDSQQRSSDTSGKYPYEHRPSDERKTPESNEDGKKKEQLSSKIVSDTEDEEKLVKAKESVKNSNIPPSNSKEVADNGKPGGFVVARESESEKLEQGDLKGEEQSSRTLSSESKTAANKDAKHAKDPPNDLKLVSPAPKQNDDDLARDNTTQESVSAKASKENVYKGKGRIENEEKNGIKEEEISKPLSSIKEENLGSGTLKTSEEIKSNGKKGNGRLMTEDGHKNQDTKKSSSSSITGRIRQSVEKLVLEDEQMKRVSNSSNKNSNRDEIRNASINSNENEIAGNGGDKPNDDPNRNRISEPKYPDKKEIIEATVSVVNDYDATDTPSTKIAIKVRKETNEDLDQSAVDEKSQNNEATEEQLRTAKNDSLVISPDSANKIKRSSDITVTTNSNTRISEVTDEPSNTKERFAAAKETPTQRTETQSPVETQDNNVEKQHLDENSVDGTNGTGKNDPDERKDGNGGGLPISLERTTGSEDLKINEQKNRVRPGQVFVVKGDPDCYTVRWAEKRKVLAYKVGSKNTSRFSTLLIETVEQLERASLKRPSILSEFTHPTPEAKGSLLSTYLAGANARRSIKDSFTRETGTNTDHRDESDARRKSPEYQFWAKDHISPDHEAFGGAVPDQPTTADPTIQSNSYNYPFLTDYDVNHERKGYK